MERYLIISDLHLGDPRFRKSEHLVNLLENETFDILILNGDIWDFWVEKSMSRIIQQNLSLMTCFSKICNLKKIIWLLGNHDPSLIEAIKFLPGAEIKDHFEIELLDGKCLIEHGHHIDWYWKIIPHCFAKINSWVFKKTNGFIDLERGLRNIFGLYKWSIRRKCRDYMQKFGNTFKFFIIGHTHVAEFRKENNYFLWDLGEWFNDSHYIIISDNIELKKWD
jgi:UDP-2,3-diacylglucosamine pyrophosphatase LpxH